MDVFYFLGALTCLDVSHNIKYSEVATADANGWRAARGFVHNAITTNGFPPVGGGPPWWLPRIEATEMTRIEHRKPSC